ncbi:MAG: alpha/beta hydrolase [Clostridia bacterium]|nr:alpha/beta hydrolase [Clostridia bacterium]
MNRYDIPLGAIEQQAVYKRVGEHELHMSFLPPAQQKHGRAPVYLTLPGGGWHSTSHTAMLGFSRLSIDKLRKRGWVVATASYRVTPHATIDEIISDCMDAGRYLRRFARELGIDPHRIFTSGHSAGGHLALMLSHAPHADFAADSPFDAVADDFTVVGCAPMSPPTVLYADETGYCPVNFDFDRLFKGGVYDLAAAHRASPIDYISSASVPTLLFCGTHDTLVYPDNSTLFCERSRKLGAPCELIRSQTGGHCFESMVQDVPSSPDMRDVQQYISDFAKQFE